MPSGANAKRRTSTNASSDHSKITCTACASARSAAGTSAKCCVHPQKHKGRLDRAISIKAENPILVGTRRLPAVRKAGQDRGSSAPGWAPPAVRPSHGRKTASDWRPVPGRFRPSYDRPGHDRLDSALDNAKRCVINAEHHRHNRSPPAGKKIRAVAAGKQLLNLIAEQSLPFPVRAVA